ncbi:Disintegrin and metalloproteinase domain-containing protein 10 [Eumeta japonica]|uniref:Disintegrin and metalloproteinase domain-containing protein 10 n=1 Tax=Eumeta variegata TaxID=151549 RepID=A0A4C1VKH5_EUMVA|nr:Disintegrin and metalloproteinase domain-containing protein 10 [Eumeta japonica]
MWRRVAMRKRLYDSLFTRFDGAVCYDDESSVVYGVLTSDGLFDGTIWTPTEEYYVEPASRYGSASSDIHSVVYRRSDVDHPHRTNHEPVPCASHLLHLKREHGHVHSIFNVTDETTTPAPRDHLERKRRWLDPEDEMQDDEPKKNPELPLDLDVPYTSNGGPLDKIGTRRPKTKIDKSNLITKVRIDNEDSRPKPKTHVEVIKTKAGVVPVTKDVVKKEPMGFTVMSTNGTDDGRHVNKRATVDPRKTTCLVYLQADHMFFQRYGSEEACIEVMTRHVQKVNAIYKVTGMLSYLLNLKFFSNTLIIFYLVTT